MVIKMELVVAVLSALSLRNLPPTSIVVYGTMSGATNNPNGH